MMAKTKKQASTTGVRLTPEDKKLALALQQKLGLGVTQLLRLGLRALAQKEGLNA